MKDCGLVLLTMTGLLLPLPFLPYVLHTAGLEKHGGLLKNLRKDDAGGLFQKVTNFSAPGSKYLNSLSIAAITNCKTDTRR